MQVLITGGTGFIGSRLAVHFLEKGDSVLVLGQTNNPAEKENAHWLQSKGIRVVEASVTDRGSLNLYLKGIDWVFHLAAAQHEANTSNQLFWDVNVSGTKNVLEASVCSGVKRFIHGSTIGVYGSALEGAIHEGSKLNADNVYGKTKIEAEKVVNLFKEKLPVVVLRISETYGPGDRRLLKLFRAIKKRVFFIIGNGKNLHHPIFIDDLIGAFLVAATSQKVLGKTYVLSGKEVVTTQHMANVIAQVIGCSLPKWRAPLMPFMVLAVIMEFVLRPLGIQPPLHRRRMDFFRKSFFFEQELMRTDLGYSPIISFEDGVRKTASWYQEIGVL